MTHHVLAPRDHRAAIVAEAKRLTVPSAGLLRAMLGAWLTTDPADREAAADAARGAPTDYWTTVPPADVLPLETAASMADLDTRDVVGALWAAWQQLPESDRARHVARRRLRTVATSKSTQILRWLAESPTTLPALAERLPGTSYSATSVMLDRLKRRGHVVGGDGDGVWRATGAGRALVAGLAAVSGVPR